MRPRAGRSLRPRRLLSRAGWAFLSLLVFLPSGARIAGQTKPAAAAATDPLLPILTDELRRNMDGLKREATPPYFASYTVYDVQSAYVRASFGALVGRSQQRSRSAVVDVRVGDYALDNTREIRGDMMAGVPRHQPDVAAGARPKASRPTRPGRPLAGDRSQLQAGERALHQVKTNVAAKVQDGVDVADLSREPPQTFSEPARPAPSDVTPWEGRLRRVSAPFGEQPLVLTSDAIAHGGDHAALLRQHRGLADRHQRHHGRLMISATTKAADGMELPLYRSYFAKTPDGAAGRGAAHRRRPRDGRPARQASKRAARRSRTRARRSCRAAPPACSSTRFSAIASRGTAPSSADDAQTFAKRLNQPVLPAVPERRLRSDASKATATSS